MIKKGILFFVLGIVLFLAGCSTLKGAATGAGEGVKKDWQDLQQLDAKMREVLW